MEKLCVLKSNRFKIPSKTDYGFALNGIRMISSYKNSRSQKHQMITTRRFASPDIQVSSMVNGYDSVWSYLLYQRYENSYANFTLRDIVNGMIDAAVINDSDVYGSFEAIHDYEDFENDTYDSIENREEMNRRFVADLYEEGDEYWRELV